MRALLRRVGVLVAGLLVAGGSSLSAQSHVAPAALAVLSSGDLVVLDHRLGLFRYKPGARNADPLVAGFGLYEGLDVQVATIGGVESIFVTQVSRTRIIGARLVRYSLEGREKGKWLLPPGRGSCTGLAIDAAAAVAYVVSAQTSEIFRFDLRRSDSTARPLARISQESALGPMALDNKRRRLLIGDVALGALYTVEIDTGKSARLAKGLGEPSALAIDAKLDRLFIADSAGRRLWSLELAGDARPELFTKLPQVVEPKGLALDRNGAFWIGDFGRPRLLLFAPNKTLLSTVKL